MNKFTPEFRDLVAYILTLIVFIVLGFNQVQMQKTVTTAENTSTQAVQLSSETLSSVKALVVTPTPTPLPTATPSARSVIVVPATTRVITKPPVK